LQQTDRGYFAVVSSKSIQSSTLGTVISTLATSAVSASFSQHNLQQGTFWLSKTLQHSPRIPGTFLT
jgi:hypothetical protein